ncbi:DUF6573 family protein [Roseateles albus]|uniref:Uncharacterized protein n=1 Tax=Roseateles albus TaxID=2987525 RepID=A0ABT5KAP0_9BURK|nr:DUF6573 family protein [Roseateles albus]MDC8770933.1 hypothetical protein [Roseateles albus]
MMESEDLIYSYSRAQAISDGVLLDVTDLAKEAGFRYPVALTSAAWADCVAWRAASRLNGQSEAGRLWDVLTMARLAIRKAGGNQVSFGVRVVPQHDSAGKPQLVSLKMVVGPGDELEPVITLMLPGED